MDQRGRQEAKAVVCLSFSRKFLLFFERKT